MKTAVFTIGQIADELKQPPSRLKYLISKHRIKPVARVANKRLFDQATLEILRSMKGTKL